MRTIQKGDFGVFPARLVKGRRPTEQVLIAWLLFNKNDSGVCAPTMDELCDQCGVSSRQTIITMLDGLEKEGIVQIKRKPGDTNKYDLVLAFGPKNDLDGGGCPKFGQPGGGGVQNLDRSPSGECNSGVSGSAHTESAIVYTKDTLSKNPKYNKELLSTTRQKAKKNVNKDLNKSEEQKTPSEPRELTFSLDPCQDTKTQKESLLGAAEALYELYPRKVGRGDAIKAIRSALKKVDFPALKSAVEEYRAAVRTWPKRYRFTPEGRDICPHPSTWFNQERWKDDRSEWVVGAARARSDRESKEFREAEKSGRISF